MRDNPCVQCMRPINPEKDFTYLGVCTYPDCPNYGLYQLGVEGMAHYLSDKKE